MADKTKTKAQLVVVGWQLLLLLWKNLILQVRSTSGAYVADPALC